MKTVRVRLTLAHPKLADPLDKAQAEDDATGNQEHSTHTTLKNYLTWNVLLQAQVVKNLTLPGKRMVQLPVHKVSRVEDVGGRNQKLLRMYSFNHIQVIRPHM